MKKVLLLAILVLLLLLVSCAVPTKDGGGDMLRIFYPTVLDAAKGGDAVESVALSREDLPEDRHEQAVAVVERIMAGDEHHRSPIPAGTELRSCTLAGGIVTLDFSAAYGQLSGMDMTLADYCLTLSLTELPDIYGVRITVMGAEPEYRKRGVMLAGNVLLTSTEDVVRELAATLYFPDEQGILKAEERLLLLYEGQSRAGVVLDALLAGPETEGLLPLLPEGFAAPAVRTDAGVCYVNIAGDSAALLPGDADPVLSGISQSIRSVEGIAAVQFLVDGVEIQ